MHIYFLDFQIYEAMFFNLLALTISICNYRERIDDMWRMWR